MNGVILKHKIRNKIWSYLKEYFYLERIKDSPLVQNINYDSITDQRKVLICYLPNGFFQELDLMTTGRTIPFEIFKIIKVFSKFGYCIDIIGANDVKALQTISSKKYDVIFGFGEAFYKVTQLQPEAKSILYMTENHPEISYIEEKKRIDYFYERHHKVVKLERSGRFYKKSHLDVIYDNIIVLGETEPFRSQYHKPYSIFPTGIVSKDFEFKRKDHSETRKHFLWLGSNAVIHKGLDLLIDVFANRSDVCLHICGLDDKSRKILHIPESDNILDYGYVRITSEPFIKIVEKCSYSILPSCSEGMATSITTSMLHGLIPVVMKDTGFNRLGQYVIFLDDYRVDYLNTMISKLAEFNPAELGVFSGKIREFATQSFVPAAFEKNLRTILLEIIEDKQTSNDL